MLIATAREMANLDRETIEGVGIPGAVLMENAARGAASFFLDELPDLLERKIVVLAGSGNNAGDGFVLARLFWNKGAEVTVICLRSPSRLQGDALTNYKVLERLGVPIVEWDEARSFDAQWEPLRRCNAVIDAILGTGLNSEVRGLYRQIIDAVNDLDAPVLSVDIPSGLDAASGKPLGSAVRAIATATFGLAKVGCLVPPGEDYAGKLCIVDIGIPPSVVEASGIKRFWLDNDLISEWLEPRQADAHKGRAGHVAVLSGSPGKTGAATLICQAAGRVGAGLVTLMVPHSLNPILEVKLTEAMTLPIPETSEHTAAEAAFTPVMDFLQGKSALAMGPGLSLHPETRALMRQLVAAVPLPMVLDADALTALSDDLSPLKSAPTPPVLTPHPGEMARMLHENVATVRDNRLDIAASFSKEHNVVLVLKGHRTVIAAPDGRLAINGSGNPAMASGGMGDALTGMIAGFIAQGFEAFQAACLGVYVHGAAADQRIGSIASRGLMAGDLLEEIPSVIGRLEGFEWEN